jgi:hypothetical protein
MNINIKPSIKVVINYINKYLLQQTKLRYYKSRNMRGRRRERGSLSHLLGVKKMRRGVWYL